MSVEPFPESAESLPYTERAVREELAAAHRLSARYGMIDLTHTHFSARVPDSPDHFLISPYGRWFHEVTASGLVKVNGQGNVVGEAGASIAGFIIHEAIYSVRPDVRAIFHTHTRAGVAVAALECGLLPISQFALRFHGRVAYHDYEGATLVEGERDRLRRSAAGPEPRSDHLEKPWSRDARPVGRGRLLLDVLPGPRLSGADRLSAYRQGPRHSVRGGLPAHRRLL